MRPNQRRRGDLPIHTVYDAGWDAKRLGL